MNKDREILESLIVGGLIGAALGALIGNDKNNSGIGALAGAAILASLKANEKAQKTNIPLLIEEDNALYELSADGSKKLIKLLPKSNSIIPKKFILQ